MGSTSNSEDSFVSGDGSTVPPSSPLFLLPSDSPSTVLVYTTFDGTGYGSWRRGMLLGCLVKTN